MRLDFTGIAHGFILADSGLRPESDWFEPGYWAGRGAGEPIGAGRGQVVSAGERGRWVLRHYRRGGLPGRLLDDVYPWRGLEAARPVRELRVLAALCARGAPVARPVAARVLRSGPVYRADILTERIAGARPLGNAAARLTEKMWARVGAAIRRFHEAGGWHADLNANNILVAPAGAFVIDLDRGRIVAAGSRCQRRNLARLRRSFLKLGRLPAAEHEWQVLLSAYREGGG